jgi:hypothetical protein
VQPVVDPCPVGLVRDGLVVPQGLQARLGGADGVQDLGERDVAATYRAQVGPVGLRIVLF